MEEILCVLYDDHTDGHPSGQCQPPARIKLHINGSDISGAGIDEALILTVILMSSVNIAYNSKLTNYTDIGMRLQLLNGPWRPNDEKSVRCRLRPFITHGEKESANALKDKIEKKFHWCCLVPEYLDKHELT